MTDIAAKIPYNSYKIKIPCQLKPIADNTLHYSKSVRTAVSVTQSHIITVHQRTFADKQITRRYNNEQTTR